VIEIRKQTRGTLARPALIIKLAAIAATKPTRSVGTGKVCDKNAVAPPPRVCFCVKEIGREKQRLQGFL
jgi:hypothetical protein